MLPPVADLDLFLFFIRRDDVAKLSFLNDKGDDNPVGQSV